MSAPARAVDLLRRFRSSCLWVAGDLMLDEYLEGEVLRISPEAPVQVVKVGRAFHRLGGAANVARSAAALGAEVHLAGVVGDDAAGDALLAACKEAGIHTAAIARVPGRATVRKLRVLAQHQHLLRMDWDSTDPVDARTGADLLARLVAESGNPPSAIVLSDYAKGFFGDATLRAFLDEAARRGVPALVDPKRYDYQAYRGATVITPNLRELHGLLGITGDDPAALAERAAPLVEEMGLRALVVTLGDRGMLVIPREGRFEIVQAASREVFDVTGAGDTVIAVLALGLGAKASVPDAARLANTAAGIVVGKLGTASVSPDELARALSPRLGDKVIPRAALAEQVAWWRMQGRKVVFTNGCFDLLHVGHLSLLRQAGAHGDVLVVGLNSDASVARLKGDGRPLIPEDDRAAILAAVGCVDAVVIFDEDTPEALIAEVLPDVLVKGADYRLDQIIGREIVEARGGRVELVPVVAERSTSALVEKIRTSGPA